MQKLRAQNPSQKQTYQSKGSIFTSNPETLLHNWFYSRPTKIADCICFYVFCTPANLFLSLLFFSAFQFPFSIWISFPFPSSQDLLAASGKIQSWQYSPPAPGFYSLISIKISFFLPPFHIHHNMLLFDDVNLFCTH